MVFDIYIYMDSDFYELGGGSASILRKQLWIKEISLLGLYKLSFVGCPFRARMVGWISTS